MHFSRVSTTTTIPAPAAVPAPASTTTIPAPAAVPAPASAAAAVPAKTQPRIPGPAHTAASSPVPAAASAPAPGSPAACSLLPGLLILLQPDCGRHRQVRCPGPQPLLEREGVRGDLEVRVQGLRAARGQGVLPVHGHGARVPGHPRQAE